LSLIINLLKLSNPNGATISVSLFLTERHCSDQQKARYLEVLLQMAASETWSALNHQESSSVALLKFMRDHVPESLQAELLISGFMRSEDPEVSEVLARYLHEFLGSIEYG